MTTRAIDNNNDWCYGHNNADLKKENKELIQCIKTRLQFWKYDCFFDYESGIDWNNIFGNFNLNNDFVKSQVYNCLINTNGVKDVNDLIVDRDNATRDIFINATVVSIYGEYKLNEIL
jgi:hypothetical protein